MKTAKPKVPTTLNPVLKFRLSKNMLADIDHVIDSVSPLSGFSRSKFIRAAVRYALDSLAEEAHQRTGVLAGNRQGQ